MAESGSQRLDAFFKTESIEGEKGAYGFVLAVWRIMGKTMPVNSPVGSRRPVTYPAGLTIGFRESYEGQINRIYFAVRNPGKVGATVTVFFWRGNYAEKRMEALTRLATVKGYSKVPSTWLEAVAEDHDEFCKQCFIECKLAGAESYFYKD